MAVDSGAPQEGLTRSIAKGLLAQAAVVGAVFYYFGYVRTRSAFDYYGIDPSILDLSPQDYLLRSVNSVGVPLLVGALVYLGLRIGVAALPSLGGARLTTGRPAAVAVFSISAVAGIAGIGEIIAGQLLGSRQISPAGAVLLSLAFLLGGAGVRQWRPRGGRTPAGTGELDGVAVAAFGLSVLLLFAAVTGYADRVGRADAQGIADNLAHRPVITLYSEDRLEIGGYGSQQHDLPLLAAHYHYRYDNLRLLAKQGNAYLFIPAGWRPGAPVFLVPAADGLRIDINQPTD
jgi:hypothetical protein